MARKSSPSTNSATAGRAAAPETVTGAQTLLRALDILDRLTLDGGSATLVEISTAVGLKMPTTHRLLKALMLRGMVVDDGNRHYSLGPGIMHLASAIMNRANDLTTIGTPVLERIRAVTGETVSLHTIVGAERVCVAELVSPEPIRMESGVGHAYPLYAGAAGKALIAWDAERIARLPAELPGVGPATIGSLAELERELAEIRAQGYATSMSEVVAGAGSLAVPLFGNANTVVAAINVTGPDTRWNADKIALHAPGVLDEARRLMKTLASAGPPKAG
jgi:IclR family KDG regulon transcriptional repressor